MGGGLENGLGGGKAGGGLGMGGGKCGGGLGMGGGKDGGGPEHETPSGSKHMHIGNPFDIMV